ncbi:RNA polymerase factor sigma-32 [Myxococcota bacterium]|nr:RNA polymerase factor sigma-32 [Myxococcota bacterium]MBU1380527.1 RNA polymerase factor sigma-32 [Myxococcota bacterium]MBU1497298.1 RNA polymerase factor sigma-32 [Myxococcota bacterium]
MASGKKKNPENEISENLVVQNEYRDFIEVPEEEVEFEEEEEEDVILDGAEEDVEASIDEPVEGEIADFHEEESALVRYDPLRAYIQQVRRYPLLSQEEEFRVASKYWETKDPSAAKKLVTSNLRLVVKIAHEYAKAHYNLLDLIQEGNVGLIQAVDKYDPYRGVKLSTYSSWWIRAYILKYLLNNWRLVKIGTTQAQRKLFFNLYKQQEALTAKGIVPTTQALAIALDVPEHEVREMQKRLGSSDLSLSAPVDSDESDSRTMMDLFADPIGTPDEIAGANEIHRLVTEKIREFAMDLKGRDLVIMRERLLSDEPLTLKEIGDRYGISRERARQLEKRLLKKLREHLEAELGENVNIALGFE